LIAGHFFGKALRDGGEASRCQMTYPIGNNGYIRLTYEVDEKMPFLMMSVLHALQKGIDENGLFPQELIPQPAFQQSYGGSLGLAVNNVAADRQSLSFHKQREET
jgi:hypothetical protein